jgi:hypothetical protein
MYEIGRESGARTAVISARKRNLLRSTPTHLLFKPVRMMLVYINLFRCSRLFPTRSLTAGRCTRLGGSFCQVIQSPEEYTTLTVSNNRRNACVHNGLLLKLLQGAVRVTAW